MSDGSALHPRVAEQLAKLQLRRDRPLIITDADEVLFAFMVGFEGFLEGRGLYFDWKSFALLGNVRRRLDDAPVPQEEMKDLIEDFFEAHTETLQPVPGAAEALAGLAERAQVIVLSNVPMHRREARSRSLAVHGMDYPLIANLGTKGEAVRELGRAMNAPVFFIDDIPRQHSAVRLAAAEVVCLHFVADPRLAALLGPADDCHHRADTWPDVRRYIEARLDELGY